MSSKKEEIIEYSNLPDGYKQSNWLMPTLLSLNTYSFKIFSGVVSAWNKLYMDSPFIEIDELDEKGNPTGKKIKTNEKDWSLKEIRKRNRTISFDISTFMNELGYNSSTSNNNPNSKEYNRKFLEESINDLKSKSNFIYNEKFKDEAPGIYDAIKQILEENKSSDKEVIDFANISMFHVWTTKNLSTTSTGKIYFKVNDAAVPIFDSISKNFTYLHLDSIKTLVRHPLNLYAYLKQILGDNKSKEFIVYFSPSSTNEKNNLRYLLNLHLKTKSKTEYDDYPRETDFVNKVVFKCFDEINQKVKDLHIDYDIKDFVKKGNKNIGIKIFLTNPIKLNENIIDSSIEVVSQEHTQLSSKGKKIALENDKDTLNEFFNEEIQSHLTFEELKSLYFLISSDIFISKHFDVNTMDEAYFNLLTKDYITYCFNLAKKTYYMEMSKIWRCSLVKVLYNFLKIGSDIYQGQIYKNSNELPPFEKDVEISKNESPTTTSQIKYSTGGFETL